MRAAGRGGRALVLVAVGSVVGAAGLAGCHTTAQGVSSSVVVSTDYAFGSLNAATPAGSTPGSRFVRGLTHAGFFTVDDAGAVHPDAAFGTVEKVSDSPLTVRYTLAAGDVWSDGVPVTPDDLLLEWAARSAQYDEVSASVGVGVPAAPTDAVWFGAASPTLVHATAVPTLDGSSLILVYDSPVADWQTALDVNVPAHVIGRLALGTPSPTPGARASGTASATGSAATVATGTAPSTTGATGAGLSGATSGAAPTTSATAATAWSTAVSTAIRTDDHTALLAIAGAWRSWGTAAQLASDPTLGVSTGAYAPTRVADTGVVLGRSGTRAGAAARFDTVTVRSDLDPLDQVAAVGHSVDVALPVWSADVVAAARGTVHTGTGAVLQLVLQEGSRSVFDVSADPAAAARRAAFTAAADPSALAAAASATRSDVVLAGVGPRWGAAGSVSDGGTSSGAASASGSPTAVAGGFSAADRSAPASSGQPSAGASAAATPGATSSGSGASATTVRLLVSDGDPVRAAMVAALKTSAAAHGLDVQVVDGDVATHWSAPTTWDAALVPVSQSPLAVASVVARWHTGGASNASGHADAALDARLDALATTVDPAAVATGLAQVATTLAASGAVLPVAWQPTLAVTTDDGRLGAVTAVDWGGVDQTAWWSWALVAS